MQKSSTCTSTPAARKAAPARPVCAGAPSGAGGAVAASASAAVAVDRAGDQARDQVACAAFYAAHGFGGDVFAGYRDYREERRGAAARDEEQAAAVERAHANYKREKSAGYVKRFLHGMRMGLVSAHERNPGRRGFVSSAADTSGVGRLRDAMMSIPYAELFEEHDLFFFTGTFRDCPASPDDAHAVLEKFLKRLKRVGLARYIWVKEWQPRQRERERCERLGISFAGGVPHYHVLLWFPHSIPVGKMQVIYMRMARVWCECAAAYGADVRGQNVQHVQKMTDKISALGDARIGDYFCKHAVRGVWHAQRDDANMPAAWRAVGRAGRLFASSYKFPFAEVVREWITPAEVYARRRIQRGLALARARCKPRAWCGKSIRAARRMLSRGGGGDAGLSRRISNCRAVTQWIAAGDQLKIDRWLSSFALE